MNVNEAGIRLGEIYAQALFELARDSNMVDAVKYDLDALHIIAAEEKGFATFLSSPYFSQQCKEQLLRKVFSAKLADLTTNFLTVAVGHDRMMFLPQITSRYDELWDVYHGRQLVKVTVSEVMSDDEVKKLSQDIAGAIKGSIKLELAVNPAIIGGVVIRYGDRVIDNTVKGRLHRAVKALTSLGEEQEKIGEV